jgi:hypothetical protein
VHAASDKNQMSVLGNVDYCLVHLHCSSDVGPPSAPFVSQILFIIIGPAEEVGGPAYPGFYVI